MNRKYLKAVLAAVCVAAAAALFWFFYYTPLQEKIQKTEEEISETEGMILNEKQKSLKISEMKDFLLKKDEIKNPLADFDNKAQEHRILDDMYRDIYTFYAQYKDPVTEKDIARRKVSISFTADSYSSGVDFLREMANCGLRTGLGNINIVLYEKGVNVLADVTFYEVNALSLG